MSRHEPEVPLETWQRFVTAHADGGVLQGQVRRVEPFGAFVELDEGVFGFLHESEWHGEPRPGTTVSVRILQVDLDRRRCSLALC
jgi:ribosomal protein S1